MNSRSIEWLLSRQIDEMASWQTKSISVTGSDSQRATYNMGDQLLYVMEPDMASTEAVCLKIDQYMK